MTNCPRYPDLSQKFNSVVMAGGFGSRLSPMTNTIPKPMLPVSNRSTFERILDLLADNNIKNTAVTTMYLSEQLEAVRHDRVHLSFFKENEPKGSAGAVRALVPYLEDTVLILSGDAVCDFELQKYIEKHKTENHMATLLLTRTKKPQEFGTVLVDKNTHRIHRFLEKPSWADTLSGLINTGIYIFDRSILEMIPENVFFDFGRDLFPLLMQRKIPLYGEEADGFWCDIGSFNDFYECNMLFSNNENIFGVNCTIHPNAKISGSILFGNVTVGESEITNSILCENVTVGDGCVIPEGCVVGAECKIGDRAVLAPGIKISDHIKIGKGARIMGNVFMNSAVRHLFGDEGISGSYGSELNGELCFKLGQSLTVLGKPARVGVMNDGSENAGLLGDIIKVGVRSSGGLLYNLEDGFPEIAAFGANEYDLDCSIFVSFRESDKKVNIRLYEKNALLLSREKQRKVESAMRDNLVPPESVPQPVELENEQRVKFRYCHYLQNRIGQLGNVKISYSGTNEQANFFFSNARELGAEVDRIEDLKCAAEDLFIFDDGNLRALTGDGLELSFWQLFVLAVQSGDIKELFLPQSTPEAVEQYLNELNIDARFYNDNDSEDKKRAFETNFYNDSVLLALLVCRYLHLNMFSLDEAALTLPSFFFRSFDIDIDEDDKADIIGALAEECEDCSRGVRLRNDKGSVAVFPRAEGGFRVFAEAVCAEFADDLCDFARKKIKKKK